VPELPEVETIAADLRPQLVGHLIERVESLYPGMVRHPDAELFKAGLRGRRIEALTRRGKYLLFHLDSHELFVVHLGMTGQLRVTQPDAPVEPHTHLVLRLVRRFGRLLFGTEDELLRERQLPRLGPEPLDPTFTGDDLYLRLKGRRAPLKALLLDQAVVAGVGNIYADESLYRARIRPDRPAGRLSRKSALRLRHALRDTLELGIANRGSSVDDYRDGFGERGRQQEELLVYGRAGQPCPSCGRPLAGVRLAGRTTVFCRRCQR
jgi:formamidopyrimidine-DNA glycosylase